MEETSDGTILKSPVADQVMGSPGFEFLATFVILDKLIQFLSN